MHQICKQQRIRTILDQLPNFFLILQTLLINTIYLILWLFYQSVCDSYSISGVRIYCECCSLTSTFGALSFSSISYKQKKISLVFRTHEYSKKMRPNQFNK